MVPPFVLKSALAIIVVVGVYLGLSFSGFLPVSLDFLKKREPTFVETALNVEEVKAIAKLVTQRYENEFIVRKFHKNKGLIYDTYDELLIIARGTCYAGTDLSNMKNSDIKVVDSLTVNVTIPKAEILQRTINPSGFQMITTKGFWLKNIKAVQKVKVEAVKKLERMARRKDILKKADLKSISTMKLFMKGLGFKNVNITLR